MAHTHSHGDGNVHSHDEAPPRPLSPASRRAAQIMAHGHSHDIPDGPGSYIGREMPDFSGRDFGRRAYTIGIGGPVGSGKTALVLALCQYLRPVLSLGVVTNDIFTREDCEFLVRNRALPSRRLRAVVTGGCPHAAVREDISSNLGALEELHAQLAAYQLKAAKGGVQKGEDDDDDGVEESTGLIPDTEGLGPDLMFVESGGDNLAANFSRELADYIIYVVDVSGGDKIPRKGGPGTTQSDLLIINKTSIAEAVGTDLNVMERDAKRMR